MRRGRAAPAPLEDRLRAHPLISQAVVVGDARPFIAALIALDPEVVAQWAAEHGIDQASMSEVSRSAVLRAAIQTAVDDANLSGSRAESIREFALLPENMTVEDGQLTPTLKVRRNVVEARYADLIGQLYGESTSGLGGPHHVHAASE